MYDMKRLSLIVFLLSTLAVSNQADAEPAMSLDQYLSLFYEQNLSLKAESAEVEAARAGASGIELPPPMVAATQMRDQSGQANGFEINQTIPFPTKIWSDRSARKHEAAARAEGQQIFKRQILSNAKLLYFKLWKSQETLKLLADKRAVVKDHIKLATAGARSDSFLKIHLLKSESDYDFLENEMLSAEQSSRELQIQLAELANQDPRTFKMRAEEPAVSSIPKSGSADDSHQIAAQRLNVEKLSSRDFLAKSSWLPDLNFRYREMGGTTMNPRYSEFMIGATLPFIFFWEPYAASNKASAEYQKARLEFDIESRRVETRRVTLEARAESLKKQLEQFKLKLLPRAERRMGLVHNLAPRDMETLQDHRETMEAFPELKLKALDLRMQYEETVVELETFSSEKIQ